MVNSNNQSIMIETITRNSFNYENSTEVGLSQTRERIINYTALKEKLEQKMLELQQLPNSLHDTIFVLGDFVTLLKHVDYTFTRFKTNLKHSRIDELTALGMSHPILTLDSYIENYVNDSFSTIDIVEYVIEVLIANRDVLPFESTATDSEQLKYLSSIFTREQLANEILEATDLGYIDTPDISINNPNTIQLISYIVSQTKLEERKKMLLKKGLLFAKELSIPFPEYDKDPNRFIQEDEVELIQSITLHKPGYVSISFDGLLDYHDDTHVESKGCTELSISIEHGNQLVEIEVNCENCVFSPYSSLSDFIEKHPDSMCVEYVFLNKRQTTTKILLVNDLTIHNLHVVQFRKNHAMN
jgi:hypothetical protein